MSAATEQAAPAAHDAAAPAAGGGKGGMMKMIIIIVVVMSLEAVGLFFMLCKGSSPAATSEHADEESHDAHGASGAHGGGHGGHGGHDAAAGDSESTEVTLETFMTTNNKASPGSIIHMTFRLVCIVATAQRTAFEHAANEEHRHRVRETVLKVARSASMEDLSDPDLSSIKRLFREEINKVLRKSYVTEVVISDFKTIEQ